MQNLTVFLMIIASCLLKLASAQQIANNWNVEQDGVNTFRSLVAQQNILFINRHNADPEKSVTLKAYPRFIGLTIQEFRALYTNKPALTISQLRRKQEDVNVDYSAALKKTINRNVNQVYYTDLSSVAPTVYDQGRCGNCYAYTVTGSIDINNKIRHPGVPQLSPAHLTDCSSNASLPYYNLGCQGGNLYSSMWFAASKGIYSLSAYPISTTALSTGQNQPCRSLSSTLYKIPGWYSLYNQPSGLCYNRMNFLLNGFSVATYIFSSFTQFIFYSSGLFVGCPSSNYVDHAVVITGFRFDNTGSTTSYFKLKNSWGIQWGQSGYFYMIPANICHICQGSQASF